MEYYACVSGPDGENGVDMATRSGHVEALKVLDDVLGKPANLRVLRKALQAKFDLDPCSFLDFYTMKQVPKLKTTTVEQPTVAPIEIVMSGADEAPPEG